MIHSLQAAPQSFSLKSQQLGLIRSYCEQLSAAPSIFFVARYFATLKHHVNVLFLSKVGFYVRHAEQFGIQYTPDLLRINAQHIKEEMGQLWGIKEIPSQIDVQIVTQIIKPPTTRFVLSDEKKE